MSDLVEPQGLLTVPAEVRNLIYKELWTDTVIYLRLHQQQGWEEYKGPESLNLLQSCHAIKEEALPVLLRCCRSIVIVEISDAFGASLKPRNPFSWLEQSAHLKNLPTRLLQILPYVKQIECRLVADQPWFPLRDQLNCLPRLEKLVLVNKQVRATDQFLLDHSGWFSSDEIRAFFKRVVEMKEEKILNLLRGFHTRSSLRISTPIRTLRRSPRLSRRRLREESSDAAELA